MKMKSIIIKKKKKKKNYQSSINNGETSNDNDNNNNNDNINDDELWMKHHFIIHKIKPKRGNAVLFSHNIIHKECNVNVTTVKKSNNPKKKQRVQQP